MVLFANRITRFRNLFSYLFIFAIVHVNEYVSKSIDYGIAKSSNPFLYRLSAKRIVLVNQ